MSHSSEQRVLVALGGNALTPGGDAAPETQQAAVEVAMDLSGALLARSVSAGCFIVATDVPGAAVRFGTRDERWLGSTTPDELRRLAREGHFGTGSMGPKVEACARFVEGGGTCAVIAPLDRLVDAAEARAGTVVEMPGARA